MAGCVPSQACLCAVQSISSYLDTSVVLWGHCGLRWARCRSPQSCLLSGISLISTRCWLFYWIGWQCAERFDFLLDNMISKNSTCYLWFLMNAHTFTLSEAFVDCHPTHMLKWSAILTDGIFCVYAWMKYEDADTNCLFSNYCMYLILQCVCT